MKNLAPVNNTIIADCITGNVCIAYDFSGDTKYIIVDNRIIGKDAKQCTVSFKAYSFVRIDKSPGFDRYRAVKSG